MKALILAAALAATPVAEQPSGVVAPPLGEAWCYPRLGYCIATLQDFGEHVYQLDALRHENAELREKLEHAGKRCAIVIPEKRT